MRLCAREPVCVCVCASKVQVFVGFFFCFVRISAQNQKKKKKSRLHILAHVGCLDWRNRENEEVEGNAQRYIMYAVSTNHRFLYKPSNHQLLSYHIRLQPSLWILHNYHVFLLLPGIHNSYCIFFFFFFTHFILQKLAYYRYKVFCYHTSFSVGLFALHKLHKFKEKLRTTLLIHTMNYDTEYVCFHQTKEVYVSCIAYSVKA